MLSLEEGLFVSKKALLDFNESSVLPRIILNIILCLADLPLLPL